MEEKVFNIIRALISNNKIYDVNVSDEYIINKAIKIYNEAKEKIDKQKR